MRMQEIIERAGGATKLARIVGRSHSTVLGWTHIPARHLRVVSAALNIPVEQLLPPAPVEEQAA